MKKIIITLSIVLTIVGLALVGGKQIGIATAVAPAEDNCIENGYDMYCVSKDQPIFVDMDTTQEGEKFVYWKTSKLFGKKLFKIANPNTSGGLEKETPEQDVALISEMWN